jgi:hypothetical protein
VVKRPPVHIEPTAAEFPVRTQQKVKFEDPVIFRGQNSPADKAEVSRVFFILQAKHAFALLARICLQGNLRNAAFFIGTFPESLVAGAKNSAKNAGARGRHLRSPLPQS